MFKTSTVREMEKLTLRHGIIYAFLAFYVLYAFVGIGVTGLLFSFAIGLIAHSFEASLEITVSSIILSGIAWKVVKNRSMEGFKGAPTGTGHSANEVVKTLQKVAQKTVYEPSGVLSSSFAEGFADAETPAKPTEAASAAAPPAAKEEPAAPAAPASAPAPAPKKNESFSDNATDGMFKLGSVPADVAGGSHIDIGTTMMNAMNALKPDQVKQMTDDTRKLLETQKNLMGMLSSMKPMLQDGKQLMSTFNDMFGKGGPQPSS
jgi:hypothetical protein